MASYFQHLAREEAVNYLDRPTLISVVIKIIENQMQSIFFVGRNANILVLKEGTGCGIIVL